MEYKSALCTVGVVLFHHLKSEVNSTAADLQCYGVPRHFTTSCDGAQNTADCRKCQTLQWKISFSSCKIMDSSYHDTKTAHPVIYFGKLEKSNIDKHSMCKLVSYTVITVAVWPASLTDIVNSNYRISAILTCFLVILQSWTVHFQFSCCQKTPVSALNVIGLIRVLLWPQLNAKYSQIYRNFTLSYTKNFSC